MSKLETNTIDTISGSTNLTLGGTNATDITIPSGVTITNNGTQSGFGGTNTPAFQAILSSTQTLTNNTYTKIQYNTEIFDTDNVYDNSTNYRFTAPSDGKYFLYSCNYAYDGQNAEAIANMDIAFYKNGSQFHRMSNDNGNAKSITSDIYNISATVDASTNDYFELYLRIGQKNGVNPQVIGGTSPYHSWFGGYKIIE